MSNLILPADEKQPMILCQKSSEFDLWDSWYYVLLPRLSSETVNKDDMGTFHAYRS